MGLIDPLVALVVSFCLLGVMLYRRINLGITLNATALLLALLSVDWLKIPLIVYETTTDALTIAIVLATFTIMLLAQLYKETKVINNLSDSAGKIIHNSKIVSSVLPAVIGFLPVAGGALMSAPLVDSETKKLGLSPEKKAYVNIWFRHTIFPIYPISQVLIITAALTKIPIPLVIMRQIPVVAVMVIVGYLIGFWKVSPAKEENSRSKNASDSDSNLRRFLIAFSPILVSIVVVACLDIVFLGIAGIGIDVVIATVVGLVVLIMVSKPNLSVLTTPFKRWDIYGVTLAAYGAFLLRNVTIATGISAIFKTLVIGGTIDIILLLTVIPAVLGFVTGSPQGGVAISVSVLAGILTFSAKTAALLYMSAYLGYLIVPSHLCFAFTADYFKCTMNKIYRYMLPSFIITFVAALLVYFLM